MATDNSIDYLTFAKNIASLLPSVYSLLGALFMLVAFGMTFSAIVDFAQASEKNKKYLGTHQASALSGIVKLIIAGVLANFAYNGQAATVLSSIFFTVNDFQLVSIDSYVARPNENLAQKYSQIIIFGVTQAIGLIAIFKGLRIWAKASDRSSRESAWHGLNYVIFGTLAIQIQQVLAVITNTIGFNFFSMIGLV